jgi:hypothetical protein
MASSVWSPLYTVHRLLERGQCQLLCSPWWCQGRSPNPLTDSVTTHCLRVVYRCSHSVAKFLTIDGYKSLITRSSVNCNNRNSFIILIDGISEVHHWNNPLPTNHMKI